MFENILTVGTNVIILFVIIGIGFLSNKTKIFSSKGIKDLTTFVLYVVTPCTLVNSFQREFDKTMLVGLGITVCVAFATHIITILLAHLFIHTRDKNELREKTLIFASVFSNCGYMSLPLQQALLGDTGVFYGAAYIAVFQVIVWTYGIVEMTRDFKNISLKKIIINPGVIGTIAGLIIFLFSINVPVVIKEPIGYFAALNTPLPMLIVGYRLADAKLNIKGIDAWMSIILRLIITPVLVLFGLYFIGVRGAVLVACVIAASAPAAANTTMFSEKFGGDTGMASAMVSVTTLLSVITMPFIVGIATML